MPRLTFDADSTFDHTLEHLLETTPANSKAEVIRNAVAVYNYLKGSLPTKEGIQSVEIKDTQGKTKMVLIT